MPNFSAVCFTFSFKIEPSIKWRLLTPALESQSQTITEPPPSLTVPRFFRCELWVQLKTPWTVEAEFALISIGNWAKSKSVIVLTFSLLKCLPTIFQNFLQVLFYKLHSFVFLYFPCNFAMEIIFTRNISDSVYGILIRWAYSPGIFLHYSRRFIKYFLLEMVPSRSLLST